jgi:hypothetical protein
MNLDGCLGSNGIPVGVHVRSLFAKPRERMNTVTLSMKRVDVEETGLGTSMAKFLLLINCINIQLIAIYV